MNRNMKAILWAIEQRQLDPIPFRLLIMLAARVGKRDYNVWPSYQTMAKDSNIGHSTARKTIAHLVSEGLIEQVDEVYRHDGSRSVNVYRLKVNAAEIVDRDDEEEDDYGRPPMLPQSRGHAPTVAGALLSAEHGNEPLSTEPLSSEHIPIIPSADVDLFGQPIDTAIADDEIAQAFIDRWNRCADVAPKLSKITRLGDKRRTSLLARVDEYEPARSRDRVIALLDRVVSTVEGSRFCRGEKMDFKATPDWALTPTYFPKLEETGYVQDVSTDNDQPAAGDRPAERSHVAAGLAALEIRRARRERGAGNGYPG